MHALWDSGYSSTLSHGMDAYLFVVLHIYFLVVGSDCYNLSIQIGYGLCAKEDDDAHQQCFVASNMRSSPLLLNVFATNKKFDV